VNNSYILIGAAAVGVIAFGGKKVMDLKVDLAKAGENEKKFAPYIQTIESKYGIPSGVLHRLLKAESSFLTSIITGTKRSSTGAMGIAQFMPATAREWLGSEQNALNPSEAIDGAARYLKWIYNNIGMDWTKTVAAYNWGIGNVKNKGLSRAPSETKKYVKKILGVTL
jgi:soluble lytic murein transglycosylase-like protein